MKALTILMSVIALSGCATPGSPQYQRNYERGKRIGEAITATVRLANEINQRQIQQRQRQQLINALSRPQTVRMSTYCHRLGNSINCF
jgi:hypothetical protein